MGGNQGCPGTGHPASFASSVDSPIISGFQINGLGEDKLSTGPPSAHTHTHTHTHTERVLAGGPANTMPWMRRKKWADALSGARSPSKNSKLSPRG